MSTEKWQIVAAVKDLFVLFICLFFLQETLQREFVNGRMNYGNFCGRNTEACVFLLLLWVFFECVLNILYVHNVEKYSCMLSEDGLVNTWAVLSFQHTIQLLN